MAMIRSFRIPVAFLLANSTTISSGFHNGGNKLQSVYVAAWTAAPMVFLGSDDGVTFKPVFKDNAELSFAVTADKELASADLALLAGYRYMKIQSGPTSAPVAQAADRTIYLTYTTEA